MKTNIKTLDKVVVGRKPVTTDVLWVNTTKDQPSVNIYDNNRWKKVGDESTDVDELKQEVAEIKNTVDNLDTQYLPLTGGKMTGVIEYEGSARYTGTGIRLTDGEYNVRFNSQILSMDDGDTNSVNITPSLVEVTGGDVKANVDGKEHLLSQKADEDDIMIEEDFSNYVDLGLPSGNLWAKCNLGATTETEYGKYYQWGAPEGYYAGQGAKEHSTWSTCPGNDGSSSYDEAAFTLWRNHYCPGDTLLSDADAAYLATDGLAHMPTKADFEELIANTTNSYVTIDGINGNKFTAANGNYIFIPAGGYANSGTFPNVGYVGYVWSSSFHTLYREYAWYLLFTDGNKGVNYAHRYVGRSIRPIISKDTPKPKKPITDVVKDIQNNTITLSATLEDGTVKTYTILGKEA